MPGLINSIYARIQNKRKTILSHAGRCTNHAHIPEKLVFKSSKFGYRVIETLMFSAGSLVGGILGAYGGAALQQEGTVIGLLSALLPVDS